MKIIEFAPYLMGKLRQMSGIDEEDIICSLDPLNNREQIFKTNNTAREGGTSNEGGGSGSFFFFTEDSNYIVKTVTPSER